MNQVFPFVGIFDSHPRDQSVIIQVIIAVLISKAIPVIIIGLCVFFSFIFRCEVGPKSSLGCSCIERSAPPTAAPSPGNQLFLATGPLFQVLASGCNRAIRNKL